MITRISYFMFILLMATALLGCPRGRFFPYRGHVDGELSMGDRSPIPVTLVWQDDDDTGFCRSVISGEGVDYRFTFRLENFNELKDDEGGSGLIQTVFIDNEFLKAVILIAHPIGDEGEVLPEEVHISIVDVQTDETIASFRDYHSLKRERKIKEVERFGRNR